MLSISCYPTIQECPCILVSRFSVERFRPDDIRKQLAKIPFVGKTLNMLTWIHNGHKTFLSGERDNICKELFINSIFSPLFWTRRLENLIFNISGRQCFLICRIRIRYRNRGWRGWRTSWGSITTCGVDCLAKDQGVRGCPPIHL